MEEFSNTNKNQAEEFDLDILIKMQQMHHSSNMVSNDSLQWRMADEITSSAKTSAVLEEIEDDDFSTSITSSNIYDSVNMSEVESYPSIDEKKKTKSKKNKKHKKHKKDKKHKKKVKKYRDNVSDSLLDRDEQTENFLAELMKTAKYVVVENGRLWIYNEDQGCFRQSTKEEAAKEMRSLVNEEDQMKLHSKEYKEAYNQLLISKEIELDEDNGFFANKPYVNCLNGVVDVMNNSLIEHDPEYRFKHCINANFDPDAKCPLFKAFVEKITGNDPELKKLLRVMMGYLLSHYNNAKKAFVIFAQSHVGKSVLCNLIERMIGSEYVSNVELSKLQRPDYADTVVGKLLNIAPDLSNERLKDSGMFKAMTSKDDTIVVRPLYSGPYKSKCETKMLFSTNHYITLDHSMSENDRIAVFNRLLYFPFMNKPITEEEDNKNLSDDLYKERNGIFTWAIKGLKAYIDNNENFPHAVSSEVIKTRNMSLYSKDNVFFDTCLIEDAKLVESSMCIKSSYELFCKSNGVKPGNINRFLQSKGYVKKRIRFDPNTGVPGGNIYNVNAYQGLRLKDEYRVSVDYTEVDSD